MNVDIATEIAIGCPRSEVAAFASDPDNTKRWYVNIKEVEWQTDRPVQLGSRIAFVAHFLGRKLSYTYEVVELVTGERFVMRTSEGPFPMEITYTFESIDDRTTKMTLRNQGKPSGFSALMAPLMKRAMRRANEKDLQLLKTILEAGKT